MPKVQELAWYTRYSIGAAGGLAAVITKYLGQDHEYYVRFLENGQTAKIMNLWLGYAVMGVLLVVLGIIVAWISYENHRTKLFFLAVSAPAIITTYAGGSSPGKKLAFDFSIAAYAQEGQQTNPPGEKVSISNAIKLFFGIGKDDDPFRVYVGGLSEADAKALADRANKEQLLDKGFFVVGRRGGEWGVMSVEQFSHPATARWALDKVSKFPGVGQAKVTTLSDVVQ